MTENTPYENFPLWIPLIALCFSIILYALGAWILIGFGIIVAVLYILYCVGLEMMVVFRGCKYCYYYGKVCGLGKGKLAPLFTKRGDPRKFSEKQITIVDLLPDFSVTIFPIIGGIILSILDFSPVRVGLMILLLVFSLGGTAFLRGSFACKYCKQRLIGCPATKIFKMEKLGDSEQT
jgi:hypothetical protein